MIRQSALIPTDKNRAAAAASTRRNQEGEFGEEEWAIDPLDKMGLETFLQFLVDKFGPAYLEPVPYAWVDGEFRPVVE